MNADQLREVRERHAMDSAPPGTLIELRDEHTAELLLGTAAQLQRLHSDRACLLAEVDRLNAFVEKVRATTTMWGAVARTQAVLDALTELRASK